MYTVGSGTAPTISSITGLGGTWSEITNALASGSLRRLSVWVGTGCGGSGTLVITPSATPTGARYNIIEFTGGIDNTATPYVASSAKTFVTSGAGTSLSITPNALGSANNAVCVWVQHLTAQDVTPLISGIEINDDNSGVATGIETNYLAPWTSGAMGGSWSTSGAARTGVLVEIKFQTVLNWDSAGDVIGG